MGGKTRNDTQAERDALRAAGMKRCSSHLRLLDQLEDERAQRAYDEYPVEVRRLEDFARSTSNCRACDSIIQRDWRQAHKAGGSTTHAPRTKRISVALLPDELSTLMAAYPGMSLADVALAVFRKGMQVCEYGPDPRRDLDG